MARHAFRQTRDLSSLGETNDLNALGVRMDRCDLGFTESPRLGFLDGLSAGTLNTVQFAVQFAAVAGAAQTVRIGSAPRRLEEVTSVFLAATVCVLPV